MNLILASYKPLGVSYTLLIYVCNYITALLKIARDAAWLLNQRGLLPRLKSFCNRCLCLLADCGLATYSGRVDATELLKAFKNYYSPNLLLALMCEVDAQSQHNWLLVLTEVVETREEFAVRRVRWAAECFRQENVCPQQWHLVRRAGLRPEMAALPLVLEAIFSAMSL